MSKNTIEPNTILTIDIQQYLNIPLIVTDKYTNILHMCHIDKFKKNYFIRQDVIKLVEQLIIQFNIDTIILEQNKLFIDKIDRHPDPYVLRDIMLGFGIKTSIEDKFYTTIKYIIELPLDEWRNKILNSSVKYSIDLYKSHILERGIGEDQLNIIDKNNYYKSLCLSESTLFDSLMNTKYQINKGD